MRAIKTFKDPIDKAIYKYKFHLESILIIKSKWENQKFFSMNNIPPKISKIYTIPSMNI